MPIKYLSWRQGLIASPECRLPLTRISDASPGGSMPTGERLPANPKPLTPPPPPPPPPPRRDRAAPHLQQITDLSQQHLFLGRWRGRRRGVLFFLIMRLMPRMTRNSTKAMMMKLTVTVMKVP